MKLRAFIAAAVVLAMATSAQAVSLVVMATNTTAIAGQKVYTIGVTVSTADLAKPGVGADPGLFIQKFAFPFTAGIGPFQASGANNKPDIQAVQATYDSNNFPDPPAGNTLTQIYKDSWWYNSGGANGGPAGVLNGYIDQDFNTGPITTNPTVGPLGFVWQPQGDGLQGGGANTTMTYTGLYGPLGSTSLTAQPLAGQFVNNVLTVPLAQIIVANTMVLPFSYSGGLGTFLSVGQAAYDWLGDPTSTQGDIILDYANNSIHRVPEPSTVLLAGMGALGLVLAWRRRK